MKRRNESGQVVIEASIVVTLVLIFITIMLYIGMLLYQQTLISVMANQTASKLAQEYGNNLKDPFTGYVDSENLYQSITYSNMKTNAYTDIIKQKAEVFAEYRLKSSRILPSDKTEVDVEIVEKNGELLKSQIVVNVREYYNAPLVSLFGTDGAVVLNASGRADCIDIIEYVNSVDALCNSDESNITNMPDSYTCLVTFISDRESAEVYNVVPVSKGETIVTSNGRIDSSMPDEPEVDGYIFEGWVTDNGTAFTEYTKVSGDIIVYAKWTEDGR